MESPRKEEPTDPEPESQPIEEAVPKDAPAFADDLAQDSQENCDSYIDCKRLKAVMKAGGPGARQRFFDMLEQQVLSVLHFMRTQQETLAGDLEPLTDHLKDPSDEPLQGTAEVVEHCKELVEKLEQFKRYADLNAAAVQKIMDRFRKHCGFDEDVDVLAMTGLWVDASDIETRLLRPAEKCRDLVVSSIDIPASERPVAQLTFWLDELRAGSLQVKERLWDELQVNGTSAQNGGQLRVQNTFIAFAPLQDVGSPARRKRPDSAPPATRPSAAGPPTQVWKAAPPADMYLDKYASPWDGEDPQACCTPRGFYGCPSPGDVTPREMTHMLPMLYDRSSNERAPRDMLGGDLAPPEARPAVSMPAYDVRQPVPNAYEGLQPMAPAQNLRNPTTGYAAPMGRCVEAFPSASSLSSPSTPCVSNPGLASPCSPAAQNGSFLSAQAPRRVGILGTPGGESPPQGALGKKKLGKNAALGSPGSPATDGKRPLGAKPEPPNAASRWWTGVKDICPISGFPVNLLPHPPFKLQRCSGTKDNVRLVDGPFLVLQVLSTWQFEALGRALTSDDIMQLDAYMKRCKLGPFRLGRALELSGLGTETALQELKSIRARARRRFEGLKHIQRVRFSRDGGAQAAGHHHAAGHAAGHAVGHSAGHAGHGAGFAGAPAGAPVPQIQPQIQRQACQGQLPSQGRGVRALGGHGPEDSFSTSHRGANKIQQLPPLGLQAGGLPMPPQVMDFASPQWRHPHQPMHPTFQQPPPQQHGLLFPQFREQRIPQLPMAPTAFRHPPPMFAHPVAQRVHY